MMAEDRVIRWTTLRNLDRDKRLAAIAKALTELVLSKPDTLRDRW
jgi:hypothetical protein